MFEVFRKQLMWGGRRLVLETGKIARQADGAVLATYGETTVLCTAVAAKTAKAGQDFFPLTVNYQEKTFAAGKIPGGFFKREGRPSEKETLVSRLIDRPIRPLFMPEFRNETQVVCTVLSHDLENDPDIVAMVGASAALTLSGIPFLGPIGGARVGFIDGQYVLNPTLDDLPRSQLDLIVAGTQQGVLMVESEAKELSEATMLGAVTFGHQGFQPVIEAIIELAETCAKEPWPLAEPPANKAAIEQRLRDAIGPEIDAAYRERGKQERSNRLDAAKLHAAGLFDDEGERGLALKLFKDIEKGIVRGAILRDGTRIDGRDTKTVRPIDCQVGLLPRAHGSVLFTRGETQAVVVATLGTGQDEQIIDALEGEYRENFMLHYNFPPYATGEAGRMGSPGRREVGHGKLAWRAVRPLLPPKESFPYTIRVVSEITESNGSSSMASVCGASLSLMDAGVPLARPVAGIAMGLIKEPESFAVLSDILGDEDHLGDMDFKVAGTERGITALQMDIKITSITEEIMRVALEQAKDGRAHILGEMAKALTGARHEVSENAPRITTFAIPKDKIREVIGSGGKVIREITETTGAKIDIDDDGTIKVAAVDATAASKAIEWIRGIVAEPELNQIYNGKVVKVVDFGAFVNFLGSKDGLVHISELAQQRVGKVADVVKMGDQVKVKVLGFDDRGKVKLSMRQVDQQTGEDRAGPPLAGDGKTTVRTGRGAVKLSDFNPDGRVCAGHPLLPAVIGHRGAAARAPENTLAGFRHAAALGCTWVEFDVRLTADGVPVLCHDPRVDRTTDGRGLVSALTFAAIRDCNAGITFAPAFSGERMPLLEEALLLCAELGLGANIELKAEHGRQYAVGAAVAAALQRLSGRIGQVLVSSFLPLGLYALRQLAPQVPRGVLFRIVPRDWSGYAQRLGCTVIGADHRRLRRRRVVEMRQAGYQVAAYTVNDPLRARLLYRWGVTAVFSDVPDIILQAAAGDPARHFGPTPWRNRALARQGAVR